MTELWQAAFAPSSIFYTILLMVVGLYWITVFIGLLDLSSFHFEIDAHADLDAHAGLDAHTDLDAHADSGQEVNANGNPILSLLGFFNLGKVPFMVFFSFLVLFMWIGSILGNHYLRAEIPAFAWAWILPNLLISLSLTKAVTSPLRGVFKDEENEFKNNQDVIGKVGTAMLPFDDETMGQVSIPSRQGAPLLIRAKATEGKQILKGFSALVVHYDEEKQYFLVEPYLA
ncbi:MAG: YqiJ family protein [Microscillaceae bacterium]|nr:YqiJ family protein [Microscillaceae bacterium]